MSAARKTVSVAIAEMLEILEPHAGQGEVVFDGEGFAALIAGLEVTRLMAIATERELGAFRLLEAGRFARGVIEEVATDAVGALVLDPDGKVVRPSFGGRP